MVVRSAQSSSGPIVVHCSQPPPTLRALGHPRPWPWVGGGPSRAVEEGLRRAPLHHPHDVSVPGQQPRHGPGIRGRHQGHGIRERVGHTHQQRIEAGVPGPKEEDAPKGERLAVPAWLRAADRQAEPRSRQSSSSGNDLHLCRSGDLGGGGGGGGETRGRAARSPPSNNRRWSRSGSPAAGRNGPPRSGD